MKEKFWNIYDGIYAFITDLRSEYRNRLIRRCLRHMWLDSATMRMMIHKMGKSNARSYLEDYDETEAYWQEHGSPFDK